MSFVLFIVSALLIALGKPAWHPAIGVVAALAGYALFWRIAVPVASLKKRFFVAAGWFACIQLIQLSWMTSIEFQGYYILLVYLALSLALGAQFGLLTLLIDRVPLIASASLWALFEWSRLYFLCGFTFCPVGLALTTTPYALQAASLFGIFGLSFLVMLTNLAVWRKKWGPAAALALVPYLCGGILWHAQKNNVDQSPTLNVALVQTALLPSQKNYFPTRASDYISPYLQWNQISHMLASIEQPVDLVVLPESALPYNDQFPLYSKEFVTQILHNAFKERTPIDITPDEKVTNSYWVHQLGSILKADVILGLDGREGEQHYSSAFFASQGKMDRYDKQILLPLAEYLPFKFLKQLTRHYGIQEFYTHGKKPTLFNSKIPLSATVCYEETFGHIMRNARRAGAGLFVNVTNDNWYPHSTLPQEHFDLARVQAVACGTPLVRSCNAGITSGVDCLGRVVGQLDAWDVPDILKVSMPLHQVNTLYLIWGDWGIVTLSTFFLILTILINRKSLFIINK